MKLCLVPGPVRGSSRLFRYGRDGQCLIAKHNEPGKGDHRPYGRHEEPYEFTTPEKLVADCLADVCAARRAFTDTETVKLLVGGSIEDDAAAFVDTWHRAERGERTLERVLAFESWEALASVLTGERYRLLRHLHKHREPSVSALARSLGRQYRRVHADVTALEGPVYSTARAMRCAQTVDRISAEIALLRVVSGCR